ncbi:hypothetical protein AbraCBS73388_007984, partial [Aspergillus brasiliensis]
MILLLELELARRSNQPDTSSSNHVLQMLERSCDLWSHAKDIYEEAARVHEILAGMISSFGPKSATTSPPTGAGPSFDFQEFSPLVLPFDSVAQSLDKE